MWTHASYSPTKMKDTSFLPSQKKRIKFQAIGAPPQGCPLLRSPVCRSLGQRRHRAGHQGHVPGLTPPGTVPASRAGRVGGGRSAAPVTCRRTPSSGRKQVMPAPVLAVLNPTRPPCPGSESPPFPRQHVDMWTCGGSWRVPFRPGLASVIHSSGSGLPSRTHRGPCLHIHVRVCSGSPGLRLQEEEELTVSSADHLLRLHPASSSLFFFSCYYCP